MKGILIWLAQNQKTFAVRECTVAEFLREHREVHTLALGDFIMITVQTSMGPLVLVIPSAKDQS